MKHIHVACAIVERKGLVLAAQRSAGGSMPLKWEFPGGKVNPGESARECIRRELIEELGIRVRIERDLPAVTHRYPRFTVTLYPFVCAVDSGDVTLHEHAAITWRAPRDLRSLDWSEADVPVLLSYLA